ncbi:MAG TPA: TolC family protein, partial [Limnobacter sp.]|nr:TolC family protein [Limnobacter sp.]
GTFYQSNAASADVSRSKFQTASVMQEVERDVRFYHSEVEVGLKESVSRLQAIEAAELSRTANERSFKGGVRTRIDVLNSVQVLFSTREEYLNTVVRLTRNHFELSRNSATPVTQTISELQQLLF